MRKYRVYVHVCPNGKRYVGVTTASKPEYRWGKNGEGYCQNKHFYSAILKYGWNNIEHEVFEVDSEEEMYRKEVELISFYHSNDPEYGYNHSSGGEKGALGCIRSEEYRKKLSESHKGKSRKPFSEEARKHMSEAHKGQPAWNKGKLHSEETKRRISEAKKGTHPSEEARKKMSEARKGKSRKPFSEEARKHMSEAHKGRTLSEETKKKMSEIQKNKPRIKISLPDGTVLEMTKQNLVKNYVNKGRKFEYVS